jgi:tRNA threonylcarbamoyladenosine biosynthesis protein TsaE
MEADSYHSHSEDDTREIGKAFAARLKPADVITLTGDLGAGKTEFVRGVCQYFSVEDIVSSPTFTIINQYFGAVPFGDEVAIYHVDLYRINDSKELDEIGFDECMADPHAIKFVEWPEKAGTTGLPSARWSISITFLPQNDEARMIEIRRVEEAEPLPA